MDNICHTLAGAAFGEAGLKRMAPFGNVTLMIAANLPDVDAMVFATELPSVAVRRGWTHGVLAQALLPVALAGVMTWLARRRRRRAPAASAGQGSDFGALLLLSYVGVLSHVLLDLLNNYGVRLLMPFSNRWFYGDAVFIVDVWLWLMLGLGVWLARRFRRPEVVRTALVASGLYILALVGSAAAAREVVLERWLADYGTAPEELMVGPVPITPFTRAVIVETGSYYRTGTFTWFPTAVAFDARAVPKRDREPAVLAARESDPRIRAVLVWARFPYYEVTPTPDGTQVTLRDLRFGDRVGGVRAVVAAPAGSARPADRSR